MLKFLIEVAIFVMEIGNAKINSYLLYENKFCFLLFIRKLSTSNASLYFNLRPAYGFLQFEAENR